MKVAFVAASMSRQAGGLATVMRPLAASLCQSGDDLCVVAGRDSDSDRDRSDWGVTSMDLCPVVGPRAFGWQPQLLGLLRQRAPDLVHLHGLWMYPSLAVSRWSQRTGSPLVISPHGMLDPWALRRSAWKKRLVSAWFEKRNLQGAACLHALNDAEYRAIRDHGLTAPVAVIPNGVDTAEADQTHPAPSWATRLPPGARVLLFLGRLHPKKGLPALITAYGQIGAEQRRLWHLVVAGWDQGGHEDDLKRIVHAAGLSSCVHFVGPQFGAEKFSTLAHADAFVLPSQSEGLPMAVLEAWSFRLPVLMTEACNLPEGFVAGAAARLSLAPDAMSLDLQEFLERDPAAHAAMGRLGRALVDREFIWKPIARKMLGVYTWCCGKGERPACVRVD